MSAAPRTLRVVVAEDGELVRAGVLALLGGRDDVTVVGVATSLPELLAVVDEARPDVVLTDVRMPPDLLDEGIRAAACLRVTHPGTGVVVLTQHADVEYALDLVAGGSEGRGFLLKERVSRVGSLVAALRTVAAGGSVIDETVVAAVVQAGVRRRDSPLARLTPREREVLALLAGGRTNRAIGEEIVISEGAVEKHVASILAKLDLPAAAGQHRRVAATLVYLAESGTAPRVGSHPVPAPSSPR